MAKDETAPKKMKRKAYEKELRKLQVQLCHLQEWVKQEKLRVIVIFEGRDAAGKDGTIKRIVEHLSPRETRVVALSKPSDRETTSWYFQRYAQHLPAARELVLFNRSWYNRAGVERVMGFCTKAESDRFLEEVVPFEHMLIGSGIQIIKYYLDIGKKEQKRRLRDRRRDPLKQWKTSPIDRVALKHWDAYTDARNLMLSRTSTPLSPWLIVRADDKHLAHLTVIRDLLSRVTCPKADKHLAVPDQDVVFPYDEAHAGPLAD